MQVGHGCVANASRDCAPGIINTITNSARLEATVQRPAACNLLQVLSISGFAQGAAAQRHSTLCMQSPPIARQQE